MGNAWSLCPVRTTTCVPGVGLCVSLKHGLVIVSDDDTQQLRMYSLENGSLVRSVGGEGRGKGQFSFSVGGLCISPDGERVLVADYWNNRVQEVRVTDGSWVRFLGHGIVKWPEYLDCSADVLAVSETGDDRVSVLSYRDGGLLARCGFGDIDAGGLSGPRGLRLLAAGNGLVVADCRADRLCVFTLDGEFVKAINTEQSGTRFPTDVLECVEDGSFAVANCYSAHSYEYHIMRVSPTGEVLGTLCNPGYDRISQSTRMAALPDGGLVVREASRRRLFVFRGDGLRLAWVTACVTLVTCDWRAPSSPLTTKRVRYGGT